MLSRRREMDELENSVKSSLKEIDEILDKIEEIKNERNQIFL